MRIDRRPGRGRPRPLTARGEAIDPADVFPARERGAELRSLPCAGGLGAHKWADRAASSAEAARRAGAAAARRATARCSRPAAATSSSAGDGVLRHTRGSTAASSPAPPAPPRSRSPAERGHRGARSERIDARGPARRRRGLPHRLGARGRAGPLARRRSAPRRRRDRPAAGRGTAPEMANGPPCGGPFVTASVAAR